jgi:hypothetical protein
MDNQPYFGKRDTFYYVILASKEIIRDNKISEILGLDFEEKYASPITGWTTDIWDAKFWKDESAVIRYVNRNPNSKLVKIDRSKFISLIPDNVKNPTERYLNNLKIKQEEVEYLKEWTEFRKKYKATDSYVKVKDPENWIPCKSCGLIPLVNEFDNGRWTACGCGENEYNNFSIRAESVMSYYHRRGGDMTGYNTSALKMNWNQWVLTGQDIFKQMKINNPEIW